MKLLTFAIPCYNSQDYMENCIKSLLPGGDDVEILIIDDGSKDSTGDIADAYEKKYPGIIRAIHQVNGGHGEAVNAGIRNATGLYFKVVDSDDWVDEEAYKKILDKLRELTGGNQTLDMFIANYVYEKEGAHHKKVMHYTNLPQNQIFTWNDVSRFRKGQYILMHSVIYRTELLKSCGLVLPKHTFYVDNIFAFQPFPYVEKLYYMDENLYHYFIGRDDQSVNEKVMIGRIDQQIRVNKIMIDVMGEQDFSTKDPHLKKYMLIYLSKIMMVTSMMLILDGSKEALAKKADIWAYLKEHDAEDYKKLRAGLLGILMNLPGRFGRRATILGYKAAQKFVGFN